MKLSSADITPSRLTFNSHLTHNPNCDILELAISRDAFITYYIDLKTKVEGMEYYSGEKFVVDSNQKYSTSRHYKQSEIPRKYRAVWNGLKYHYENKLNN